MPYFGNNPSPLLLNTLAQNGKELTLDADSDTSITADTDDQIDIKIAGADDFQFTANTFTAQSGSTIAAQALTATTITASGIIKTDDATDATSTTDGSLQTDGGLSVVKDAVFGDDVKLLSDSAVLSFGADSDVTITHDPDDGLILKSTATGDDNPFLLTLQTGETDIQAGDVIGQIDFQAPDEGTGTDSRLVAASIVASSEGDFAADNNATMLAFHTGSSETATEKFRIESSGSCGIAADGGTSSNHLRIGASADFKLYHDGTNTVLNNGTGALILKGDDIAMNSSSGESMFSALGNSSIRLYHDNVNILQTTTHGIEISRPDTSAQLLIKANTSSGTGTPQQEFLRSGTRYGFLEGGVNSASNGLGDHLVIRAEQGDVYAIDSGGVSTQLSPHNFVYIPDGASETDAWCYKSDKFEREITEKDEDGNKIKEKIKSGTFISADMTKVIRQVEKLTGEKLIYKGTLDIDEDGEVSKHNDDGSTVTENIIAGLIKRIEALESA